MGDAGLAASAGHKQVFVSAHSDLDTERASSDLELSKSFAHSGGAARQNAIVQVCEHLVEPVVGFVAGQKRLQCQREEKGA